MVLKAQNQIPQQESVDAIFEDWNSLENPGASLGIIKDGKLIYAKGYGAANLEYNIPNDSKSVFRIASVSKQFTAACIVLLAQEGKLSLEEHLSKFFPEFPSYADKITVKHLLNHTSGIRDYLVLAQLSSFESEDFYTDETLMKWLVNQQELNFNPGEEYTYSNSGYWLLGQIVNKVSGVSMAEYADQKIFKPLGMNATHFHNDYSRVVKNRASGYAPNGNGFSISMTNLNMIGDGGIFTSIEDLKKWDDAFYDSKNLNKDFWKQMTEVGTLNNGEKITYAAGLDVSDYRGQKTISHGGSFVGFRAEMIRFPEQHFSVILLANRADARASRKANQIADIFLEDVFEKENTNDDSEKNDLKTISLSRKKLRKYEGIYWSDDHKLSRKLEIREDTLYYVRSNGVATKMVPIAKNKFHWIGPNIPITLEITKSKSPKEFILDIPGSSLSTYKEYTPLNSYSNSDLENYAGKYYSPELDIVYTLKNEENGISLYVKGNKISPLKQIKENILQLGSAFTLEFDSNKKEFRLSTGRVKNLKFSKQ